MKNIKAVITIVKPVALAAPAVAMAQQIGFRCRPIALPSHE